MLCAIWYHLYNLKSVKNTNGGVLQALACKFTKSDTSSCVFSHVFLNCTNGAKSHKMSHIYDTNLRKYQRCIYVQTKDIFRTLPNMYDGVWAKVPNE